MPLLGERRNRDVGNVVGIDGSDPRVIRFEVPISGLWPQAWSRDGERIVGVGDDVEHPSAAGLYTARSNDGGDLAQITAPPGRRRDGAIAFSPDGSKVLFLAIRQGRRR